MSTLEPDTPQPSVLLEYPQEALAVITLNRPDRRNGVTVEMCERVYTAVRTVAASNARVLILRGAEEHFCVGADIGGTPAAYTPDPNLAQAMYHASTWLHTMPQVTIAAIDGGCAGAGMGWALACDLRFATPRSRYSTAFLNVGVSGDMGLGWNLHRLVGPARARELLLFPDRFDGNQALAWGLVTRLYDADALHTETLHAAQSLCQRDPLALRLMKANCLSAETLSLSDYIEIETTRHLQTTNRPELKNLMRKPTASTAPHKDD